MNSELWTVTRFQPWSYKYLCLIFALSDVWYIGEHGNLGNHIFKMAELAIRRKYSWFTIWRYFEHSLALPFFGIGWCKGREIDQLHVLGITKTNTERNELKIKSTREWDQKAIEGALLRKRMWQNLQKTYMICCYRAASSIWGWPGF